MFAYMTGIVAEKGHNELVIETGGIGYQLICSMNTVQNAGSVGESMRSLGIDPGLATLGYGVIDTQGSKITLITAGAVITPPDMITPDRLVKIRCDIRELLTVYQPQEIAFEELFFSKNITTGMNVSAARGVTLCACAEYTKELFEYTPMQIKQAIVGYGKADKHQIQEMVRMILHQEKIIRPDDAADAVAVAITHANTGMLREQFRMK